MIPPFESVFRSRLGFRHALVVALALLVCSIFAYRDFVFGDKTLLYKDIGADSLNVYYPNYVLLSDYLRQHGIFSWAFEVGMGQSIFPSTGSFLISPVVWLPKRAIAQGLVYQHFIYILVAGLSFFQFLREHIRAFEACLLGSVLVAFSAYMCMGSCWSFHAAETAAFCILIYCADRAVTRQAWPYMVFGVAVMSLVGSFQLYLTALFLCLFVPARLFQQGNPTSQSIRLLFSMAGAAILGVALSAVITFEGFSNLFNSPRGAGPLSMSHVLSRTHLFEFASSEHYLTAVSRWFSNDLLGTGTNFRGWQNYLEAPMSYCGLICLILAPQAFVGASQRQRIIYVFFFLFLIVPTLFPWFRYLFWAFQGTYYRTFSLFGVIGMIALAMRGLCGYSSGRRFSLSLLIATAGILITLFFLPLPDSVSIVDSSVRRFIVMLLLVYFGLFLTGRLLQKERIFSWLIVAVAIGEVISFDSITINRPVVTKSELQTRTGYNDHTIEAVRDIRAENQGFFRITKTFGSSPASTESLNDAMVFGYYSTTSYSSFNNLDYINFLIALDTIPLDDLVTFTQWSRGLLGHPLLLAFACEEYVISRQPEIYRQLRQYEQIHEYGDVYTFRNHGFLPLGLPLQKWLTSGDFSKLSTSAKENVLLHAAVVSEEDSATLRNVARLDVHDVELFLQTISPADAIHNLQKQALSLTRFSETMIDGSITLDADSLLVLQMPFDAGWHARVDDRAVRTLKVDIGLIGIDVGRGQHRIQLHYVPRFLLLGAGISFIAALVLLGLWRRRFGVSSFAPAGHNVA